MSKDSFLLGFATGTKVSRAETTGHATTSLSNSGFNYDKDYALGFFSGFHKQKEMTKDYKILLDLGDINWKHYINKYLGRPEPYEQGISKHDLESIRGDFSTHPFRAFNLEITFAQYSEYMINTESLYLNNNQLTELTLSKEMKRLTDFDFSNNQLTSLRIFAPIPETYILSVYNNKLTELIIPDTAVKLTGIYAQNNQLFNLNIPTTLKNLFTIDLSNNQLSTLDMSTEWVKLKDINLSTNWINEIVIPKELVSLINLNLSSNRLTKIDIPVELVNLTNLNLGNNQLQDISISSEFVNLKKIYLNNNILTSFDISASVLSQITELYLNDNRLTAINIDGLANLTVLDMKHNQLSTVTLANLPNCTITLGDVASVKYGNSTFDNITLDATLETLNLTNTHCIDHYWLSLMNNNLRNLSLTSFTSVKEAYLHNNKISKLDISDLPELTTLDASNNELSTIPALTEVPKLTKLDLGNNKLVNISNIEKLTELTELNLNNNLLVDVTISNILLKLTRLYLFTSSTLKTVTISNLPKLSFLDNTTIVNNSVTEITLNNLPSLGDRLVFNCSELTRIRVFNLNLLKGLGVTNSKIISINTSDLYNLPQLKILDLRYNSKLTSISLSDDVFNFSTTGSILLMLENNSNLTSVSLTGSNFNTWHFSISLTNTGLTKEQKDAITNQFPNAQVSY